MANAEDYESMDPVDALRAELADEQAVKAVMLTALKAQHEAIDRLFALLIEHTRSPHPALADNVFLPTKSGQPWEAGIMGRDAILRAEGETPNG